MVKETVGMNYLVNANSYMALGPEQSLWVCDTEIHLVFELPEKPASKVWFTVSDKYHDQSCRFIFDPDTRDYRVGDKDDDSPEYVELQDSVMDFLEDALNIEYQEFFVSMEYEV